MSRILWLVASSLFVTAVATVSSTLAQPGAPAVREADLRDLLKATDLRPKVQAARLRDGMSPIETTPEGVRISAKVQQGSIVDWVVTDQQGRQLETTFHTLSSSTGSSPSRRPVVPRIRCWVCLSNREFRCWEVPCPKESPRPGPGGPGIPTNPRPPQ